MTWKPLLDQRKVQPHTTSKQEVDALRALIARDLQDGALTGLSADRRFPTAYNAALQTAKMAIILRLCIGTPLKLLSASNL